MKITHRTAAVFGATTTAVVVALGAVAFACTPSNLVSLDTPAAAPGTSVSMRGSLLSEDDVEVRWNGADGPILAMASAAEIEQGTASFTVPEASPGYYVVTAVQDDAQGNDMIARAAFQVVGPAGQLSPSAPAAFSGPVPTDPASSGMVGLAFVLGIGGLGLAGAGGMVMAGHARRRKVAVVASGAERD